MGRFRGRGALLCDEVHQGGWCQARDARLPGGRRHHVAVTASTQRTGWENWLCAAGDGGVGAGDSTLPR